MLIQIQLFIVYLYQYENAFNSNELVHQVSVRMSKQ